MRVLVIGGGGREHALAWKVMQNSRVSELHAAPGNGGLATMGECHAIALAAIDEQIALAERLRPDLVIIGPEPSLVGGLVDRLKGKGIPSFGPEAAAAKIEGSKAFAKILMTEAKIPTAKYGYFTSPAQAESYVKRQKSKSVVIKADGLAQGKGVIICHEPLEAVDTVYRLMVHRRFGQAGAAVVIENYLEGPECSVLAITDGTHYVLFPAIQDYKRIGDQDQGPNTGGMGSYTPVTHYTNAVRNFVAERVIEPTLNVLRKRGTPFTGCLYVGLMLTKEGPKVLEFNARFGDPETQVAMALLDEDLLDLMEASQTHSLESRPAVCKGEAGVGVVIATQGYPDNPHTGDIIEGLESSEEDATLVFHGATARRGRHIVTTSGRVLTIVGTGQDVTHARASAYRRLYSVAIKGMQYRTDIGLVESES